MHIHWAHRYNVHKTITLSKQTKIQNKTKTLHYKHRVSHTDNTWKNPFKKRFQRTQHTNIYEWITSCKMLRNCNSCCLQYWTSCIMEFRSVLSNMNNWSSGEPLAESRCDDDRALQLVRLRFSMDRVPSRLVWWKRDLFSRRVVWTGNWDLDDGKVARIQGSGEQKDTRQKK